ncbi:MAG TPA: rhodanese-like domain-containing protein, partial [Tepidisphaeraceae bacterium]|nr:rhodanese-like domain-containing protein [Tepidisphaeraceae bacterium]
SMPWKTATNDDSTFKPAGELGKIYLEQCGLKQGTDTVVYCRIGERSSHTWFVLKYLLGVNNVKNYDGSWTEWGNLVGAPIATGADASPTPNVKCQ